MKEGPFVALHNDQLPLPELSEVLKTLVITNHARQRFTQRSAAGELNKKMLAAGRLSRHSPPWRQGEDYRHSPDLYLIFPIVNSSGPEDQGCLLLENDGQKYIAKTFVSRSSNDARLAAQLPPVPGRIVHQVAQAGHLSTEQVARRLSQLKPQRRRPEWVDNDQAEQWIDGGNWAVSLHYQLVGAGNPYHYRWGQVYDRQAERKRRAQEHYRRHQQNKKKP